MSMKRFVLLGCLVSGLLGASVAFAAECPSASSLSAVTMTQAKQDFFFGDFSVSASSTYRLGTDHDWTVGADIDEDDASSTADAVKKAQGYLASAQYAGSEMVYGQIQACYYTIPGHPYSEIDVISK